MVLNKSDTSTTEIKYGVCKKFVTKLTDYFFTMIDLGTASFGNESLFTPQKEKIPLIICFYPMYIDFDEYPRYSARNPEMFENNLTKILSLSMGMHII